MDLTEKDFNSLTQMQPVPVVAVKASRFRINTQRRNIASYISFRLTEHCFESYIVAIHFNSIAIGVGKALISMVVRHGWFSLKYSA